MRACMSWARSIRLAGRQSSATTFTWREASSCGASAILSSADAKSTGERYIFQRLRRAACMVVLLRRCQKDVRSRGRAEPDRLGGDELHSDTVAYRPAGLLVEGFDGCSPGSPAARRSS